MVEFGLVLPVLFMLTVGLVDTGRAFYQYNSAANAAREAARFASVMGGSQHHDTFDWTTSFNGNMPNTYAPSTGHPVSQFAGTSTVVGTVAKVASGFDLSTMIVTVSAPDPGGALPGNTVGIAIVYPFQPASSLLIGGRTITVTASSRMIIE